VGRVGGDEFLIFLEYKDEGETAIRRIFNSLEGTYEDFQIWLQFRAIKIH